MGVGVNFFGSGGQRQSFNVDGVPQNGSALDKIVKMQNANNEFLERARRGVSPNPLSESDKGKVKLTENDTPAFLSKKLMPGGSVVSGIYGICLKGEENTPLIPGKKFYGAIDGRKGFFSIEEADPPVNGVRIGSPDGSADTEANDDHRDSNDGTGWRIPLQGRTCAEKDPVNGQIIVYEMSKELIVSPNGRIVGVTGEKRRIVTSFLPGGGACEFAVRPFYDTNDELEILVFGPSESLSGDKEDVLKADGISIVRTTKCVNSL